LYTHKEIIPCGKNLKTSAALWGTLQCHCRRLGAGSTEKPDAMVGGAMPSKIGNGCGCEIAVITGQGYLCQHRVGWVQADGYLYNGCSDACNQLQCAVEGCPIYMVQKITGWKVHGTPVKSLLQGRGKGGQHVKWMVQLKLMKYLLM